MPIIVLLSFNVLNMFSKCWMESAIFVFGGRYIEPTTVFLLVFVVSINIVSNSPSIKTSRSGRGLYCNVSLTYIATPALFILARLWHIKL